MALIILFQCTQLFSYLQDQIGNNIRYYIHEKYLKKNLQCFKNHKTYSCLPNREYGVSWIKSARQKRSADATCADKNEKDIELTSAKTAAVPDISAWTGSSQVVLPLMAIKSGRIPDKLWASEKQARTVSFQQLQQSSNTQSQLTLRSFNTFLPKYQYFLFPRAMCIIV